MTKKYLVFKKSKLGGGGKNCLPTASKGFNHFQIDIMRADFDNFLIFPSKHLKLLISGKSKLYRFVFSLDNDLKPYVRYHFQAFCDQKYVNINPLEKDSSSK